MWGGGCGASDGALARENAAGNWQFQVAKVLAIIGTISPIDTNSELISLASDNSRYCSYRVGESSLNGSRSPIFHSYVKLLEVNARIIHIQCSFWPRI